MRLKSARRPAPRDAESATVAAPATNEDGSSPSRALRDRATKESVLNSRSTLRLAQYLCGLAGILLVNFIMLTDVAGRAANAKDFIINFASDILAVGMVLLVADVVDRVRGGSRNATLLSAPVATASGVA